MTSVGVALWYGLVKVENEGKHGASLEPCICVKVYSSGRPAFQRT